MKIKRILQNNWYMLKLFFRIVPLFGTFSILFQVLCGVMYNVIGNVYFVKYLVDTVEKIAKAPDLTGPLFRQLLIITVVYYVSLQVVNTINGALFNEYLHKQAETKISERLTTMVFDKAIQMDLKCYHNRYQPDDCDRRDRLPGADVCLDGSGNHPFGVAGLPDWMLICK